MTTNPDLLAQLQAAWQSAPSPVAVSAEVPDAPTIIPVGEEPSGPTRCLQHIDPKNWLDATVAGRPGWIRTTCRRCEAFVGYRPVYNKRPNERLDKR